MWRKCNTESSKIAAILANFVCIMLNSNKLTIVFCLPIFFTSVVSIIYVLQQNMVRATMAEIQCARVGPAVKILL